MHVRLSVVFEGRCFSPLKSSLAVSGLIWIPRGFSIDVFHGAQNRNVFLGLLVVVIFHSHVTIFVLASVDVTQAHLGYRFHLLVYCYAFCFVPLW